MKEKIKVILQQFISLLPALFLTLLLLRGMEFFRLKGIDLQQEFTEVLYPALIADVGFFLKMIPVLFLVFLVAFILKSKYAVSAFGIAAAIWLIIYASLIVYFTTAHVPLGADMFGYSVKGLKEIIDQSLDFNGALVIIYILPLLFFRLFLWVFKDLKFGNPFFAGILILGGLVLIISKTPIDPDPNHFKRDFAYNVAQNKGTFFVEKLVIYFNNEERFNGEVSLTGQGKSSLKFLNPTYPFLRKEDTQDVLGPFFKVNSSVKPNFVFIQIEGLGRAFSGPDPYLGSFTPFLDELARKSIYFKNFLSAQGRTFAALPSILGSLPFAETGFSDLNPKMPKFQSLIGIAMDNGYSSTYYGGFEMEFDNQGAFMKKAGIGKIISSANFNPSIKMGSPIGYADGDLLTKTIALEAKNTGPYLSYIQTISMHNPFTVPDQKKYLQLVEARMKALGFTAAKKKSSTPYSNAYASILYTDHALRQFFEAYSKLPAFKNTIFVLTGDHRLPEIPLSTKIDRYHVPLIIYSPMLKRYANISSISSHLDIAPSLAAFLRNNYKMETPSEVTWVGTGLDTVRDFRNVHDYPLKQGKTVLHNFVSGVYFADDGNLFSISPDLDLVPKKDEDKLQEINIKFDEYNRKNSSFLKILKLTPAVPK